MTRGFLAILICLAPCSAGSSRLGDLPGPRVFSGELDGQVDLSISPDGRRVISGDASKTLILWDLQTGRRLREFRGHTQLIMSVAFSPDGRRVLSGSWDDTIRLWDVETGALLRTIKGGGHGIFPVAFSPDGQRCLSGDREGKVRLWDLRDGTLLATLIGHTAAVFSVSFSRDGRRAVSGSLDQKVFVWDLESGKTLRTFRQGGHIIVGDPLSPDGKRILLAGDAGVTLADIETGETAGTFPQLMPQHIDVPASFSPEGRYVLVEAGNFENNLWDMQTGKLVRTYHASRGISSASFTPDGRQIVAALACHGKKGLIMAWPTSGDAPANPSKPIASPALPRAAALGKLLFFDPRLSGDGSVSCSSCHDPHKGWSDGRQVSVGVGGRKTRRNALSVLNAALHRPLFWDGRAKSLEDQMRFPLEEHEEMDQPPAEAARKIASIPGYRAPFREAFGNDAVTPKRIARAIADFERTLVSMDSPFDRYASGDKGALSPEASRGLALFNGKAECFACHGLKEFANTGFESIGIATGTTPDWGRYEVTKNELDRNTFQVPILRNLSYTAPYMHDGSFKTLPEVIDFYDRGGGDGPNKNFHLPPLHLTAQEKADLLAFLGSLDGDPLVMDAPKLPK